MLRTQAEWEELADYFDRKAEGETDPITREVYKQSALGCRYSAKDVPEGRRGDKKICADALKAWTAKFPDEEESPFVQVDWESNTRGRISFTVAGAEAGYATITVGADGHKTLSGPYRH